MKNGFMGRFRQIFAVIEMKSKAMYEISTVDYSQMFEHTKEKSYRIILWPT